MMTEEDEVGGMRRGTALLLGLSAVLALLVGSGSDASGGARTKALFFGDSLISGTGSRPARPLEARAAAAALGWEAVVDGRGGTGYTTGGKHGKRYLDRLRSDGFLYTPYDVIVLEGGTNDGRYGDLARLKSKALQVIDYVHGRQPWARIVMVGGYAPHGVDLTRYVEADAILRQVSAERHLTYVSQLRYSGVAESGFYARDRYHPSNAGYAVLARDLAAAIKAA
jgi:lysophospholipase L1-like esterase